MNRKQWFVLGGIFILSIVWCIFAKSYNTCVSDSFGNFANSFNDTSSLSSTSALSNSYYFDYAYNEYNLIRCAIEIERYYIYVELAGFFAVICFIMGLLEYNKKL